AWPEPGLAITAQAHAGAELIRLAAMELEEAQRQASARVVCELDFQARTEAKAALDRRDHALDLDALAGNELPDRHDAGAVLESQRQVKPCVPHALEPELVQALGQARRYAWDAGYRLEAWLVLRQRFRRRAIVRRRARGERVAP